MASPFTELECYIILFSLLVFSLFTLHGMIHERCTPSAEYVMESPFSGFELFFIILAFTVFCVVSLAAIYTRRDVADNPGDIGLIEQNTIHRKKLKRKKEFQMSRK